MAGVFLQSLIVGYSGAVMPGSVLTYTLDRSLRHGARAGLVVSLGHAFLELLLVVLIFMGLGRYLGSDTARMVIGLLGGVVLGYLGIGMIRDAWMKRISLDIQPGESDGQSSMFLSGMVLSATNPYFLVWWSAVGMAIILSAYSAYGIAGIVVFYLGHILADISWYTGVAGIIGKARHLVTDGIYRGIVMVLALFLIGFGTSFIIQSLRFIIT